MDYKTDRESMKVDAAVVAALEAKPEVVVPGDFAARMAGMARTLPVARPVVRRRYGPMAAWVSLVVLALAVSFLAPSTLGSGRVSASPMFLLQCVLLAQMLGLALWLGSKRFPGTN